MERRQRLDDARILGREVRRDLGPGTDPDTIGLRNAALLEKRPRRRLVRPHALLERAAQLGMVRLAHEVVSLVVEGRVEEELLVLELKCLFSSRIPPLRRVTSCSPSDRARTVALFEGDRHGFSGSWLRYSEK